MAMKKVILDVDPGIDDALAIELAVNSPEIELLGITTVAGNVPVERGCKNALRTLEYLGVEGVKIHHLQVIRGTKMERMLAEGETDAGVVRQAVESLILEHPHTRIDYVTLCDPVSLEEVTRLGEETLLALAVHVGRTRLIDNRVIRKGTPGPPEGEGAS